MKSVWKRMHELYKGVDIINSGNCEVIIEPEYYVNLAWIIPCDECRHFGNCKYEKQCEQDVKVGRGLRHFDKKR